MTEITHGMRFGAIGARELAWRRLRAAQRDGQDDVGQKAHAFAALLTSQLMRGLVSQEIYTVYMHDLRQDGLI